MGWRPSSDMDAVVWTLLDGPLPIAAMVDKLEPIAEVVVVDGKAKGGRCGANAYRLLTKQERETQRTVMRQRMEPSDEVRGMFYRIEKEMKVNIIYECEYLGKRRWQRALIVRTNRGEARFGLSTRDSWNDALVEAGLI
jgi:hypothetical protein